MATKPTPLPSDPVALAKLIDDIATGQVVDAADDGRDEAAVSLGRRGGLKGGRIRAERLTPKRRSEIDALAAGKRLSGRN